MNLANYRRRLALYYDFRTFRADDSSMICAFDARCTIRRLPSTLTEIRSSSRRGNLESSVSFVGMYILGDLYTFPSRPLFFFATANFVTIFLTNYASTYVTEYGRSYIAKDFYEL